MPVELKMGIRQFRFFRIHHCRIRLGLGTWNKRRNVPSPAKEWIKAHTKISQVEGKRKEIVNYTLERVRKRWKKKKKKKRSSSMIRYPRGETKPGAKLSLRFCSI